MNKETKRVNVLFLSIILLYLGIVVLFSIIKTNGHTIGMIPSLLISESIILIPGVCLIVKSNMTVKEWIPHRRIKISTIILLILLSYALMPIASFINLLSQFVTENVLTASAGRIMSQPFWVMVLIMGLFGPFCEEFIFRGVIYSGYTKSGYLWRAILMSSLLFGLMHMNLNQFGYAFFLGVVFAIIVKVTDSLLATFIMHCVINIQNVSMMYLSQYMINATANTQQLESYTQGVKALGSSIYIFLFILFLLSIVAIIIAALLIYVIARNENRMDIWNQLFHRKRCIPASTQEPPKTSILSFPLCLAILISITWIIYGLL